MAPPYDSTIMGMEGQIISRSFAPAFVVLSYLVSWIGAWTTLELINKKTAGRGLYNWYLLVASSITMGGISIFSMHYLGNRAIILGDGQVFLQVIYSPAFTALSIFVPILVLLAAFITVGSNDKVSWWRVGLGGALAGLAILGMHFLGQAGISNYHLEYTVGNVVGSAIIAVSATITALSVFFLLRASWTASWWKRALIALILAGAVSGMHWVAEVGTRYRLAIIDQSADKNLSRSSTVIVVIVLSISACFILIILSVLAQRRRAKSANRAQQVVLAAAVFDDAGNLMVTPEGLLPSQKITNTYIERSFEDVFGISHPVFHWIYRTSRNWGAVAGLLRAMRTHSDHVAVTAEHKSDESAEGVEDYSIIFKELFCVAASDLAEQLNQPLENVGVLFDEILSTGQRSRYKKKSISSSPASSVDLERDGIRPQALGRGQLLFLTKSASGREADHFQNAGFRFASIPNVVEILARSMQTNASDLSAQLVKMRECCKQSGLLEPGIHMAYFAIRANIGGGFDVLVRRSLKSQLPSKKVPLSNLDNWQIDCLRDFDGLSVTACLKSLKGRLLAPNLPKREEMYLAQLFDTIEDLRDCINDPTFLEAVLVAKPLSVPCRGLSIDANPGQALVIAFRHIVPIHSCNQNPKFEFVPLSFFRVQQHIYKNSPAHAVFARRVHREFGEILNQSRQSDDKDSGLLSPNSYKFGGSNRSLSDRSVGPPSPNSHNFQLSRNRSLMDVRYEMDHQLPTLIPRAKASESRMSMKFWKDSSKTSEVDLASGKASSKLRDDSSSEHRLVENPFGGIMVSQEITVDVQEVLREDATNGTKTGLEMVDLRTRRGVASNKLQLGPLSAASTEVEDPETYVDSLFAACVQMR